MSTVFRQAAIDRLSTPEELDQPLRATGPRLWLSGIGVVGLIIVSLAWVLSTAAAPSVTGAGAIVGQPGSTRLMAVVFVTPSDAGAIHPGMAANLTLDQFNPQETGQLAGTVASVSRALASTPELVRVVGSQSAAQALAASGRLVMVTIHLTADRRSANGYTWSISAGQQVRLSAGMPCSAKITTGGVPLLHLGMIAAGLHG